MADFRSDRKPTPDGSGKAKAAFSKAWATYAKALEPMTKPLSGPLARTMTFDVYGFWIVWNLLGGFEGLMRSPEEGGLGMSRSAVYRRIQMFRMATNMHPDDYSVPGITIDIDTYLKFVASQSGDTPK